MRKVPITKANEIIVHNIEGYFERKVTKFGTGAKIDIPKEYFFDFLRGHPFSGQ